MASTPAAEASMPWGPRILTLWARIQAVLPKISVKHRRGLRLCETLSLGEKRIVAVVECYNQRFLLAATTQNISLLQLLGPARVEGKTETEA
jgi:flagellar biogenesis protein FliO